MRKNLFLLIGLYVFIAGMNAQVTERERPKEWQSLIKGGRFMDRFLPMQGNILQKTYGEPTACVSGTWTMVSNFRQLLSGVEI